MVSMNQYVSDFLLKEYDEVRGAVFSPATDCFSLSDQIRKVQQRSRVAKMSFSAKQCDLISYRRWDG